MFLFKRKQKVFNIGGVLVGGQPGEYSTVLAGTIFYDEQPLVKDHEKGLFNVEKATELLNAQNEWSDITKNPYLVHIFAKTKQAIEKYIDFVSGVTNKPIIIDSTQPDVRLHGLEHALETGLLDKIVYNSINPGITEQELEKLKFIRPQSAIILLHGSSGNTVEHKIKLMEQACTLGRSLIDIIKEIGVQNILIDTAAEPFGSGSQFLRACVAVKARYGLPVGSGIHNTVSSWPWFEQNQWKGYELVDYASNALQAFLGDFVLYGPIENADKVFPIVAYVDNLVTDSSKEFIEPKRKML